MNFIKWLFGRGIDASPAAGANPGAARSVQIAGKGHKFLDRQPKPERQDLAGKMCTPLESARLTVEEMQAKERSIEAMCSICAEKFPNGRDTRRKCEHALGQFTEYRRQLEEFHRQLEEADPLSDGGEVWEKIAKFNDKLTAIEIELNCVVIGKIKECRKRAETLIASHRGEFLAAATGKLNELVEKFGRLCDSAEANVSLERLGGIWRKIDKTYEQLHGETQIQALAQNFKSRIQEHIQRFNLQRAGGSSPRGVSFLQSREACKHLAWDMAECCFGNAGMVDVDRVKVLHKFLADKKNFQGDPWNKFPLLEYMRSQAFCVTGRLSESLEFQNILMRSSKRRDILASLFSPHRQRSLPSCTINSWINNMIFNKPEQLAEMYASIAANGKFRTPSGYCIELPQIVDGRVTVDLKGGGFGRFVVFRRICRWNFLNFFQKKVWQGEGIAYDPTKDRYKLGLPVLDLNDLCFAGIFQAAFGNGWINMDTEFGTMHVLSGFPIGTGEDKFVSHTFTIGTPNDLLRLIPELKQEARVQRSEGANYMRVACDGPGGGGHAFNVNVAELLAINLDKMKVGDICSIGDLNWFDQYGLDIKRLAIRKTAKGFELGKACLVESQSAKTKFEPIRIVRFMVYKTEVRQLPPPMVWE